MKPLPLAGLLTLVAVLSAPVPPALADVKPNPLFSSGVVLQRGMPVPVWGTAENGEKVTVKIQGQEATTTAENGRWSVKLNELPAGGPYVLTISGKNTVEVKDVLVGEVWVCSGQSNMEWTLAKAAEAKAELPKAADPMLRFFTVTRTVADEPLAEVKVLAKPGEGVWLASDPDSAAKFSAVGYFFGRDLRQELKVPVGLIHASWGGTAAETWTPRKQLESESSLKTLLDEYARILEAYPANEAKYKEAQAKHRRLVAEAKAAGKTAPTAPREPSGPRTPHVAALYNGMIAPLQPFAIRGAIWYQGEANAGRSFQYRTLFPAMIQGWRDAWNQGDFPFLCVQLAPYMKIAPQPTESGWAELREAQWLTTKVLPATGMAVITDVGDENDVHPRRKQPVGARLALLARKIAYGQPIVASGPEYASMEVKDSSVVLRFQNVGGGLVARDGALQGFTIAGADHKFVKAEASIEGDTVVVRSPSVEKPVAVRFGWANYPVVNLWNREGLPATPFRTDDWPMITDPRPKAVKTTASTRSLEE